MPQRIRIKMMDKTIELDSPEDKVAKDSITSALLLPEDAQVSLSYQQDGSLAFCPMNPSDKSFHLPEGWRDLQFFVDSDRPSRSSTILPTPMDYRQQERIQRVMLEWEDRVFMVYGQNGTQGSGVLISDQRLLTAAHLTFTLNECYHVKGTKDRSFRATCQFISKSFDFAILKSSDFPTLSTPTDQLSRGDDFYILGYPNGTTTARPSFTQGIIEGDMVDQLHFVGTPGSRRGYSGAPVFNNLGCLTGILLGSTSAMHIDSTIRECLALSAEQKYSRILGIYSINLRFNEGRSDNQS